MASDNIRADILGGLLQQGQEQQQQQQQQQQEQQNDNFDIDADEDEVLERDRDADGVLDGGVAASSERDGAAAQERSSSDCDLVLFLSCSELVKIVPGHPILRPGVVVSIGLDKNTKLGAVFTRYVEFCNETSGASSSASSKHQQSQKISVEDLEFVHCQLLNPNDTAETSALMRNDKINVRRVRTEERDAEAERKRLEREADREYFRQLRHLMPEFGGSRTADVIFDCRGKLLDEGGRNQQVLCTTVRGHSVILKKRCRWLGDTISQATREQAASRSFVSAENTPESLREDPIVNESQNISRVESESKADEKEEEDDDFEIEVLPYPPARKNASGAAEIENDDDDDAIPQPVRSNSNMEETDACRAGSPIMSSHSLTRSAADLLWVTLPGHSPEALKLLLEYCYTNRVTVLGHEAFVQACKTKPHKHQGPVPPFQNSASASRRWPNSGFPVVSFQVALAGITLAEEASMPRLSLMCEVAASQLVTMSNVAEALSMCTTQKNLTGNSLPRLRKAAMDVVLRSGTRGVIDLERTHSFRDALKERASTLVPSLLIGTMEAVTKNEKSRKDQQYGIKRDFTAMAQNCFEDVDREDAYKRDRERLKRRKERTQNDPKRDCSMLDDDYDDLCEAFPPGWVSESTSRTLKRMAHHGLPSAFAAAVSSVGEPDREAGDHHVLPHHVFPPSGDRRSFHFLRAARRRSGNRG